MIFLTWYLIQEKRFHKNFAPLKHTMDLTVAQPKLKRDHTSTPLLEGSKSRLHELYKDNLSHDLSLVKSFMFCPEQLQTDQTKFALKNYDLLIVKDGSQGMLYSFLIFELIRSGLIEARSSEKHIFAYFDVDLLIKNSGIDFHEKLTKKQANEMVAFFKQQVETNLLRNSDVHGPLIQGVVLGNLKPFFINQVIELIKFLHSAGVLILLELGSEQVDLATSTPLSQINGFLLHNCLIKASGEPKDYFELIPHLHQFIKLFTNEIMHRQDFLCLDLEVIGDNAMKSIRPAAINRLIKFCQFYKLTPWIASESALTSFPLCKPLVRPTDVLDFMTDARYQKLQSSWTASRVDPSSSALPHFEIWSCYLPSVACFHSPSMTPVGRDDLREESILPVENFVNFEYHSSESPGQYDLGSNPSDRVFDALVKDISTLRRRNLLESIELADIIEQMYIFRSFVAEKLVSLSLYSHNDIVEFINAVIEALYGRKILVWSALDSAFTKEGVHFWSVYESDTVFDRIMGRSDILHVYVSRNHPSFAEAIINSYLSAKGLKECERLNFELLLRSALLQGKQDQELVPLRIQKQLDISTPSELLSLLHYTLGRTEKIFEVVRESIQCRLIDEVDLKQVLDLARLDLVAGRITIVEFLSKRFEWYERSLRFGRIPSVKSMAAYPIDALKKLFEEMESLIRDCILTHPKPNPLNEMLDFLYREYESAEKSTGRVSAPIDILSSMFIAALRRQAIDDVYTIVSDFNPLPGREVDQQGVMAELYCFGSRCEDYFDAPVTKLSEILHEKRMKYLAANPPSDEKYDKRKFMLSYLPLTQCGEDLNMEKNKKPRQSGNLFAGLVFAVPAILDLVLLMLTGHGTFVNVRMSLVEQQAISSALLMSLLFCGVLSPLIACSG